METENRRSLNLDEFSGDAVDGGAEGGAHGEG